MSHWSRRCYSICLALILGMAFSIPTFAAPKKESDKTPALKDADALAAMKKAADFMENTVSNRGGFLSQYSDDFTEQWGEVPARKSQIMVQDPGTVMVGEMFLDAYEVTGDPVYMQYAKRAADALIWGQYPAGGWHYFIDFDMPGVRKYYDDVASKCWGWEEYYHYYGNCTFDDSVTSGATFFLLHLYMTTLDPAYRAPLLRALDFVLAAQYPNGGWPQRFPLSYEFPHGGLTITLLITPSTTMSSRAISVSSLKPGICWETRSTGRPPTAGWISSLSPSSRARRPAGDSNMT